MLRILIVKNYLRELLQIRFFKKNLRNCKYDGYQRALTSMAYKFFDKKTGSGMMVNEQLAEELNKPVTKKFKTRKVYARFNENIWAADLAKMG